MYSVWLNAFFSLQWQKDLHLVDAPLRGEVEAVLSWGETLHLQDFDSDGRGKVDFGLCLLETHCVVNLFKRQTLCYWKNINSYTNKSLTQQVEKHLYRVQSDGRYQVHWCLSCHNLHRLNRDRGCPGCPWCRSYHWQPAAGCWTMAQSAAAWLALSLEPGAHLDRQVMREYGG